MCGVFAAIGQNRRFQGSGVLSDVVEGLKRLEYRGYDSWGLAFPNDNRLETFKSLDSLQTAEAEQFDLPVDIALGHTRWATHGKVNTQNCHPHVSTCGRFALVHNGIVENFQQLKSELLSCGSHFQSETDTEVVLKLIEQEIAQYQSTQVSDIPSVDAFQKSLAKVFNRLSGHNTLVLMVAELRLVIGLRNGSPLVAARRERQDGLTDIYLASDCNAFPSGTSECLLLDDRQMITCQMSTCQVSERHSTSVELFNLVTENIIDSHWERLTGENYSFDKENYAHFMLKEITEQWRTLVAASHVSQTELINLKSAIEDCGKLYITGAGAAYFIGEQIAWMLRQVSDVAVTCIPAYEGSEYLEQIKSGDVLLAISQSGETADTLRFLQKARDKGVRIASVVNMLGTMMSRMSEFAFYSHCGPEVCVLSTKSGTAQLVFGYLLSAVFSNEFEQAQDSVSVAASRLSQYFSEDNLQVFVEIAEAINSEHLYLLGQGCFLAAAKVGALNIKEASYIHAEAFSAGELKHGVIALIDSGTPVICFVDKNNEEYMVAIASEVRARGGRIIAICENPNPIFDEVIQLPPVFDRAAVITSIVPCQLLAYYLAVGKSLNPDRPRNLAKSVTVI
ncbi:glutamine--fructose-6-phosphate transaminase (isomerizing) [Aliikangiella sp. G2MR2-5]|uniref:glutamine--fructose-6-phosphate transaminase (isomerizing) n=1 Tax=Aliikangiella sp. G2MR2-5 TaxID=2788943 RepID=UPI0018A8895F|nr:glutamine--fructose-6-phosphate transaminase (isomerizing) [Aliikangiella sp. G2MR2-5]